MNFNFKISIVNCTLFYLLTGISVLVSQLSYGSVDTERMPTAEQSDSEVDSPSETFEVSLTLTVFGREKLKFTISPTLIISN